MDEGIITAWMPETEQHLLAVLGKMIEECNELSIACSRAIIQGIDSKNPSSQRANSEEISREMADVLACMDQIASRLGIQASRHRRVEKDAGFDRWHELIAEQKAAK